MCRSSRTDFQVSQVNLTWFDATPVIRLRKTCVPEATTSHAQCSTLEHSIQKVNSDLLSHGGYIALGQQVCPVRERRTQ